MTSERGHLTGAGWARGGPRETCATQGGSRGGVAAQVSAAVPELLQRCASGCCLLLQLLRVPQCHQGQVNLLSLQAAIPLQAQGLAAACSNRRRAFCSS